MRPEFQSQLVTEQEARIVLEHENALMALFEGSGLDEYLGGIQEEGRKSAKLVINDGC